MNEIRNPDREIHRKDESADRAKPVRLDRWLADNGTGTRSELKAIIRKGRVLVNGVAERDPGHHVLPGTDEVTVDGRRVEFRRAYWYLLNKPAGVITATEDPRLPTVLDLFPEEIRRQGIFPVGRLDRDTEGLLLLTTDGVAAHALLTPKRHVEKTYVARLSRMPEPDAAERFAAGVVISGGETCKPARLESVHALEEDPEAGLERRSGPPVPAEATLVLTEGKFHQVKRMFEAVGTRVTALRRTTFGGLALDPALEPGAWRPLTEAETVWIMGKAGT